MLRLFPQICIGISTTTAFGKTISFLYALVLVVGPFYHRLRVYLSKVKSLITDFGTEKQINDFPDILCDLLTYLNVQLPADATTYSHLFPNSVSSPGWGHICDGLLRFVLCTFPWFAAWLRDLKFLIRFLHNHRDNLVELFMRSNCKGAASVLKKKKNKDPQICSVAVGHPQ